MNCRFEIAMDMATNEIMANRAAAAAYLSWCARQFKAAPKGNDDKQRYLLVGALKALIEAGVFTEDEATEIIGKAMNGYE